MDETRETAQVWNQKSHLEQTITAGLHGIPEIKKEEKCTYLGVFREQVITYLTQNQVSEAAIYPEVKQALSYEKFHKMILNGNMEHHFINKYQLLAKKLQKAYTVIVTSDYDEAAGLVVASTEAIELENIVVTDRTITLQKLGVPDKLIASAGKKVCKKCLNTIANIAPQEQINYSQLTWIDRLAGDHCPAHDDS
ncbi:MAG: hypothetical protein K0R55_2595 [Sporomusa sp.]|jgi:uncharacterized protein YueI|nr:hypothetical protein [Sporomusa sp.]